MGKDKALKYGDEDGPHKQLPHEHNCALLALSKVLATSKGVLAKEIVKDVTGVNRIDQLENPTIIKRVLESLKFTPIVADWDTHQHSAAWKEMRRQIKAQFVAAARNKVQTGRLFAIWWRNASKKWSDAPIRPGASDHAFTILANGTDLELPQTNYSDFDKNRPQPDDSVTVWVPPAGRLATVTRRPVLPPEDRRMAYQYD